MTIAQQLKITTFPFEIKDENGNTIYREFSNKYWVKSEYDQDGNEIYAEDSYGDITDNRPKPEPVLTAVEWLEKQLDTTQLYWQKYYIDQAKAMEKEQTEENMAKAITFGWELSHHHRLKEPEVLLKMQKDFITSVVEGGDK
jgi:hypothetical protein